MKIMNYFILLLLPLVASEYVEVKTSNGVVKGLVENGVNVFHSIPFAIPPIGDFRFKSSLKLAEKWEGVKDVTGLPNICPQAKITSLFHLGDEDCLYLHIYAPSGSNSSSNLPVLFWLFGGGYSVGDGYEFGSYDGKKFAEEHNVVIVSPNYRVGPMGFLAHKYLKNENPHHSTGNMGVQDQRLALEWAQENIAEFGGNPKSVTIFGESAGAFSVCWHLASPASKGLFHGAIAQSGSCDSPQFFLKEEAQMKFGSEYAAAFGCNDTLLTETGFLDCIRGKKTEEVMNGITSWLNKDWPGERNATNIPALAPIMPWGPVVDYTRVGTWDVPQKIFEKGLGSRVPTIFGTNKDEGTVFVPMVGILTNLADVSFPMTQIGLNKTLTYFYGGNEELVNDVLEMYPLADYGTQDSRAAAILRDCFFTCSMRRAARALSKYHPKTFLYHFEYPLHWEPEKMFGDYHGSDIDFVWGNLDSSIIHPVNSKDLEMSRIFQKYWANFARYGVPSKNKDWPPYDSKNKLNIVLTTPPDIQTNLEGFVCDFWDKHPWPV